MSFPSLPARHPHAPAGVREPVRWTRRGAPLAFVAAALTLAACADEPLPTDLSSARDVPGVAAAVLDPVAVCAGGTMPQADCEALVDVYNETDGDNWLYNDGWGTDPNPCNWYGVICAAGASGAVEELVLEGNNLDGEIPTSIGDFTAIDILNLGINPGLTGSIPAEVGFLTTLRALSVTLCGLSGALPPEIGNMTNLEELWISDNELTGDIPDALGNLQNLWLFFAEQNDFTGGLPASFANMPALRAVYLAFNELSEPLPAAMGDMDALMVLDLHGNAITGPLPVEMADMASLEVLELGANPIGGVLPPWLATIPNIRRLHLGYADLVGPVPAELGQLGAQLSILYLAGNQLTGNIPTELAALTGLTNFILADNPLSGIVPVEVAAMGETTYCVLTGTDLVIPDLPIYQAVDLEPLGSICSIPLTSAEDVGEDLEDDIWDLVPGTLNNGLANALTSKIENAVAKADNGQYQAAINQMEAFINQVQDMVTNAVLTPVQAQPFLDQAEFLIAIWETML